MCFEMHLSYELIIYSFMMPGPYDDSLQWPFKGKVIIQLLNQHGDHHHDYVFDYKHDYREQGGRRVTNGERGYHYLQTHKCMSSI